MITIEVMQLIDVVQADALVIERIARPQRFVHVVAAILVERQDLGWREVGGSEHHGDRHLAALDEIVELLDMVAEVCACGRAMAAEVQDQHALLREIVQRAALAIAEVQAGQGIAVGSRLGQEIGGGRRLVQAQPAGGDDQCDQCIGFQEALLGEAVSVQ